MAHAVLHVLQRAVMLQAARLVLQRAALMLQPALVVVQRAVFMLQPALVVLQPAALMLLLHARPQQEPMAGAFNADTTQEK